MTSLERARTLGGVQGGVEPRQMDTDVDVFTVKDVLDAGVDFLKGMGDAAEKKAKEEAQRNMNDLYVKLEAINNSDVPSAEKEDRSSQLVTSYISQGLVSYKDADSIRNMQKRGFADSITYKREESHEKMAIEDEEATLKRYADLYERYDPDSESRPFEEKVKQGRWLHDSVTKMGSSLVTAVTVTDEGVREESTEQASEILSRLVENKIFENLSKGEDFSSMLTPQYLVQMSSELEPYVHQIISSTGRKVSPEEARFMARELSMRSVRRAMADVKQFGEMTKEMYDTSMQGLKTATYNSLPPEAKAVYHLTDGRIDGTVLQEMKIFTGREPVTPEEGLPGRGRGGYSRLMRYQMKKDEDGSLYPEVTQPGYMPTSNLNTAGKQALVDNVAQQKTVENISTPEGMRNNTRANLDPTLEEGYLSLPEKQKRRIALYEGAVQAPVLAKSLMTYAKEVYKKGKGFPEPNTDIGAMVLQAVNPIGSAIDSLYTRVYNFLTGSDEKTVAEKQAEGLRRGSNEQFLNRTITDYLDSVGKGYIMKDKTGREAFTSVVLQEINKQLPAVEEEDKVSFTKILKFLAKPILGSSSEDIK